MLLKHKQILERSLPDTLKLSIAKKIENNLFSKVVRINIRFIRMPCQIQIIRIAGYISLWTQSNGWNQSTFCSRGLSLNTLVQSLSGSADSDSVVLQLLLRSETRYYSQGTIIADSRDEARGLIVITYGQVCIWGNRRRMVWKSEVLFLMCLLCLRITDVCSDVFLVSRACK